MRKYLAIKSTKKQSSVPILGTAMENRTSSETGGSDPDVRTSAAVMEQDCGDLISVCTKDSNTHIITAHRHISQLLEDRLTASDVELERLNKLLAETSGKCKDLQQSLNEITESSRSRIFDLESALSECRQTEARHAEKIADLEAQIAEVADLNSDNERELVELQSELEIHKSREKASVTRVSASRRSGRQTFPRRPAVPTSAPPPLPTRPAPGVNGRGFLNLHHNVWQFESLPEGERLPALLASPHVKNLYMLFEAADMVQCGQQHLQEIIQLRQARAWDRVSASFMDSLFTTALGDLAKECGELVGDSSRIEGSPATNTLDLVTQEHVYVFRYKHPHILTCGEPTQCGFLVKVTPTTPANPDTFDMQLLTDPTLYRGSGVHCHDIILLDSDKLHLVAEWYDESRGKWENWCASWSGDPEHGEEGDVWWGGWQCCHAVPARLVVYYNTTPR